MDSDGAMHYMFLLRGIYTSIHVSRLGIDFLSTPSGDGIKTSDIGGFNTILYHMLPPRVGLSL